MNYRHAFHAGNFADVIKHIILSLIIGYLKQKPGAFRVIDTHAGAGRYDLTGDIAKRSPEWQEGIAKLLAAKLPAATNEIITPYLDAVRSLNPDGRLKYYPGSPLLTRMLLREQDRLSALELHPLEVEKLQKEFAGDIQVRVIHLDGWLALNAHVPVKEKRGLVLVDPPFEEDGEFQRLVDGLVQAHTKWATGTYALWYPLKDPRAVNRFHTQLRATGIKKMLRADFTVRAATTPPRLYGTGMIVVNPPFILLSELRQIFGPIGQVLGDAGVSRATLDWLRGED